MKRFVPAGLAVMKAAWERLQEMDACASEEDL